MTRPVELDPDGVYHLATAAEWAGYQDRGRIDPASLETEGFVHCSYGRQVADTVGKHFAGVDHLLALRIDAGRLGGVSLVDEDLPGVGQAFPHAYGPIAVEAVVAAVPVV